MSAAVATLTPWRRGSDRSIRSWRKFGGKETRNFGHFDALDTKAGIILGFSGALIALSPSGGLVVDLGRYAAVASGLLALWTFWPRRFLVMDLRALRDLYLRADEAFTQRRVLDTQVEMAHQLAGFLRAKAGRLKASMALLALSAMLSSIGLSVE